MTEQFKPDIAMLQALHTQIEAICNDFKVIRGEAMEIVHTSQMPDATLHLNDVLQSTEEAITTILDAATAVSTIADGSEMPADAKKQIADHIGLIYEACSFQDISGQRIKKVLQHMNSLESQLLRLSETAKGKTAPQKVLNPLLNGPQLSGEAPSQAEVDQLFAKLK